MQTPAVAHSHLQAEIDALRVQYPETQALYREVCVLLFFRHGLTPTASKLYQLVRKGSMSAPAEALARFWETLREKSRVRIEHPDLPESLREAAGEMVGAVWQHARLAAHETLALLQDEARIAVAAAQERAQAASTRAEAADAALDAFKAELHALQEQHTAAQAALARAQGQADALQRQVDAGAIQRREMQESMNSAQQHFTAELEQQRAANAAAEERHAADMRRMLLEVDRERASSAKLHKDLTLAQRMLAEQAEAHRQRMADERESTNAMSQRLCALDGIEAELRGQRDLLRQEVEGLRRRLARLPAAKTAKPGKSVLTKPTPGRRS